MKKKKGFTLVELMAVIAILAIIIAIAIPSYAKIKLSVDKKTYDNTISLIKTSALKYAEDTNSRVMFVKDLIDAGYIDVNLVKNLINPETGNKENLDCNLIKVNEDAGMLYAEFIKKSYVISDTNECDFNVKNDFSTDVKIKAVEIPGNTELKKENNYWTNQDVKLTYITSENIIVKKSQWYRGYEKVAEDTESIEIKNQSLLQQLYTVKIIAEKDGIEVKYESSYYVRIDKIKPKFESGAFTPALNEWSKNKVYDVKAHDNNSGLSGYVFIKEDEECTLDITYQKNNKLHLTENGRFKVCIKDFANNIETSPEILEVNKIDPNTPTCEFEIIGTKANAVSGVQWYKSNVIVKLNAKNVGPSGVKLGINTTNTEKYDSTSFDTSLTANITQSLTTNMTKKVYYGYVINQARTKNNCQSPAIAIEKSIEVPVKTGQTSQYDTITVNYTVGSATSGIKETKCYRTDAAGNVQATGTLSGNNCVFSVTATSGNTDYYFKKCITSNAGMTSCSAIDKIQNVGYCTSGNYNTTVSNKNYTNSCGECYVYSQPTHNFTYNDTYTSKYQNKSCGSSGTKYGSESCNIQSCCNVSSHVVANVYGSSIVSHDVYNNNGEIPTPITHYYTKCQNYEYVLREDGNVKCSSPKTNLCNASGQCTETSYFTCTDASPVYYFRNIGIEISISGSDHWYFSYDTRYDSGNHHVKDYQHCINGWETPANKYPCQTGEPSRYRRDGYGNIHEWYKCNCVAASDFCPAGWCY